MRQIQEAGSRGTDSTLLTASQAGDRVAFGELYEEHVRDVYRYALRMLRDVPGAEDITQDVFTLAWANRGEIKMVDRSLLPWFLVTARNLCLNRLKRSDRHDAPFDWTERIDQSPGPDAALLDRQLAASIEDAVARLSEKDQRLYRLCLVDEMSYHDAAGAMGTTTGVVRNRLSRLRRALQVSLATHKEGLS